jgi:hypothetical protein
MPTANSLIEPMSSLVILQDIEKLAAGSHPAVFGLQHN